MGSRRSPRPLRRSTLLALGAMLLFGAAVGAQSSEDRPSRNETLRNLRNFADSVATPSPYLRERFVYPATDRPDPVLPPPVIAKRDESLPFLLLTAIIVDEADPSRSVAILRAGDAAGRAHRVATGDRIGEILILEIARKHVVIGARKLGRVQTDTLSLVRKQP